jgi:hypothetical protein
MHIESRCSRLGRHPYDGFLLTGDIPSHLVKEKPK